MNEDAMLDTVMEDMLSGGADWYDPSDDIYAGTAACDDGCDYDYDDSGWEDQGSYDYD